MKEQDKQFILKDESVFELFLEGKNGMRVHKI